LKVLNFLRHPSFNYLERVMGIVTSATKGLIPTRALVLEFPGDNEHYCSGNSGLVIANSAVAGRR
jgi:hypothetical protein